MGMILRFSRFLWCRKPESVFSLLGFFHSEEFVQAGSHIGTTFRNHTEDCHIDWFDIPGVLRSDCGEFASCVSFLIEYGDFDVLVTLTATFLSYVVDNEWEILLLS